jgi:alkaline phosphatase
VRPKVTQTSLQQDFYSSIGELDPDNGDHLLVCFGGDFSEAGEENLPFRGIDSSYTQRWCQSNNVVDDEDGNFQYINVSSVLCNHYEEDDVAQIPKMKDNVKAALDFLSKDDDGFFLMYEQGDVSCTY